MVCEINRSTEKLVDLITLLVELVYYGINLPTNVWLILYNLMESGKRYKLKATVLKTWWWVLY